MWWSSMAYDGIGALGLHHFDFVGRSSPQPQSVLKNFSEVGSDGPSWGQ